MASSVYQQQQTNDTLPNVSSRVQNLSIHHLPNLSGTLPSELGSSLTYLDAYYAGRLSGTVPENLVNLTHLDV